MVDFAKETIELLKQAWLVRDDREKFITLFAKVDGFKYDELSQNDVEYIVNECDKLLKHDDIIYKFFVYSFVITVTKSKRHLLEVMEYLMALDISMEAKYFWYHKISSLVFRNHGAFGDLDVLVTRTRLLKNITGIVAAQLDESLLTPIPKEERDDSYVVVLTRQLLTLQHGPTKHALDHAATLIKAMHKNVLLINTAEMGKGKVIYPLYENYLLHYLDKYSDMDTFSYNGVDIPFFQCNNDMPNVDEIRILLETIRELKPAYIVEIGTGSLVAALADKMIPVLSNGTMHSLLEASATRYQTIARDLTKEEIEILPELGITKDNIVYSMFTTKVKEKTENITREKIGLPANAFAVALIGTRLTTEVTPELVKMMMATVDENPNIYYVLFGGCDVYDELIKDYANGNHIINYGKTTDTISCIENCNLYLNPHRVGGGMSAIEAMAVGIPAVSTSYGDGGIVLGKDFWVEDTGCYGEAIVRYSKDTEYYKAKQEIAKARGVYLQDSDSVFKDTVEDFLSKIDK